MKRNLIFEDKNFVAFIFVSIEGHTAENQIMADVLQIHQIKSPQFRTVHANGVFGGITPTGEVYFAIYNERFPVPTQIGLKINPETGAPDGEEPSQRVVRPGLLRELEVGVYMTKEVARELATWLIRWADFDFKEIKPKEEGA